MKKIKLTPEQVKQQDKEREARYRQEAEAEAARKAKRTADLLAEHKRLASSASNMVSFGKANSGRTAEVIWEIGHDWLRLDRELTEWQQEFAVCPAHQFEWANDIMGKACEREILDHVVSAVTGGKPILEVLEYIKANMLQGYMNNYDAPNSASHAHNATMLAKREILSRYVREDGCLNRWINGIKREQAATNPAPATEAAMI